MQKPAAICAILFIVLTAIIPFQNGAQADPSIEPQVQWKYSVPKYNYYIMGRYQYLGIYDFGSPACFDGKVYVGYNGEGQQGGISALNAKDGSRLWNFSCITLGGGCHSRPVVFNGVVYASLQFDGLCAFDEKTGRELWNFSTLEVNAGYSIDSSPVLLDGKVFIGSSNGKLYALDANTGQMMWTYSVDTSGTLNYGLISGSTVVDGVVYFGSLNGKVYALNSENGDKIWSFTSGDRIWSTPVIHNGVLFICSLDGYLYALNTKTGTKLWASFIGTGFESDPAASEDAIYITSPNGTLIALNANNGEEIWSFSSGKQYYTSLSTPSSPIVVNDIVYFGSGDNNTYALNANNGMKIWNYTAGGPIHSTPFYSLGVLYVGTSNGEVYAFKLNDANALNELSDIPSNQSNYPFLYFGIILAVVIPLTLLVLKKKVTLKT
jgi:outer membrane protein assembly factor BamB